MYRLSVGGAELAKRINCDSFYSTTIYALFSRCPVQFDCIIV